MALVFLLAAFLLFVVPASFLFIGRFIVAATDKKAYAAMKAREAALAARPAEERKPGETPWYRQPMRPAFGNPQAE